MNIQQCQYFLLLIIGISALLVGCGGGGNGKETTCPTQNPVINSNAPLGQNDVLKLSVFGIAEPKSYTWEGPNGFVSHEKAPEIPNPPKGNQVYTLSVVTNGGCTYTVSSGSIIVTGPWNPCGLDSNVVKINKVSQMSFNKVDGRTTSNNYLIEADNGGLALVDFEFPNNQPPTEGTYSVDANAGALSAGRARVTVNITSQSPYTASSGTIYVAINGTTTMISFCGVNFTSTNTGTTTTTGGGNVMWKP